MNFFLSATRILLHSMGTIGFFKYNKMGGANFGTAADS